MPLFKASDVRSLSKTSNRFKASSEILTEAYKKFSVKETYDIFLSHSYSDADVIDGIRRKIESLGFSVYVDWIEDYELDRRSVSSHTARVLRRRMRNSKSLFYVTSKNSSSSKWMPWETGYFDGYKGKVAILPLNEEHTEAYSFKGQEFLGLYPYITLSSYKTSIYVVDDKGDFTELSIWLS